jgi:perosamine synthetase
VSRAFDIGVRLRRHARLMADVTQMTAWFALHGRTSISDGSGLVAEFEQEFADATSSDHALVMNSGTAALHSAYFAVGVGPGTEIIVPTYTWHATATAVLQCGATPVFADIDAATLNVDPQDVARRITERTRAICAVHLWGNPCPLDELRALADESGVALVEDCSHAHGAAFAGRPVGSWGDVGCFSMHASKPIAAGEGGVAVTDDGALYDRMILLGHVGRPRSGLGLGEAGLTDDLAVVDLGVKYRPHAFAVHLGRSQLRRLVAENARRRQVHDIIASELAGCEVAALPADTPSSERGGFYRYVLKYTGDVPIDRVVVAARQKGVPVEIEAYGQSLLHEMSLFTSLDRAKLGGGCFDPTRSPSENLWHDRCPVAERVAPRTLSFDQLLHLARPQFVARSASTLRTVAERLNS